MALIDPFTLLLFKNETIAQEKETDSPVSFLAEARFVFCDR